MEMAAPIRHIVLYMMLFVMNTDTSRWQLKIIQILTEMMFSNIS